MTALQSLKEFYEEQRGRYESPTELEMRIYHRLIHIRDQKERHEEIPEHITSHPVFKLTTQFRLHVQRKSAPISKVSPLVVDAEGMEIFGQLAGVLREQGSVVMIYLVACILERLFGKDTIEDIEAIRGDLSLSDIIDGKAVYPPGHDMEMGEEEEDIRYEEVDDLEESAPVELQPEPTQPPTTVFGLPDGQPSILSQSSQPAPSVATSAFASLASASTGTTNVFGGGTFGTTSSSGPMSVFGNVFPSVPKPAEPTTETRQVQSVFKSLGNAPPLGAGTSPPPQPARRSLADAPPIGDTTHEVLELSKSPPPSFFGVSSSAFGSSMSFVMPVGSLS